MNADPVDGDSTAGAIQQLLDNPRINTSITPTSPGGPEQSALQDQINSSHKGNPAFDTADFADALPDGPGNLRADYVLPDRFTKIASSFVFWPRWSDPLFPLVGTVRPRAAAQRQRLPVVRPPARRRGRGGAPPRSLGFAV